MKRTKRMGTFLFKAKRIEESMGDKEEEHIQVRQLMFDLESSYNAFHRSLSP